MVRILLLAASVAGLIFVGCSSDGDGVLLPLYRGEPNSDDAALQGTLVVDGRCLYVEAEGGERYLPAFPEGRATWDHTVAELTVGSRVAKTHDLVLFGGSQNTKIPTTIDWKVGPHNSCDTGKLWMSGASMVVEP